MILGHTHYPFIKKAEDGRMIINPGSVGQPRDKNSSASWAIVDFMTGAVDLRRTRFKSQELIKEIEKRDPSLPYLKDVLVRKKAAN